MKRLVLAAAAVVALAAAVPASAQFQKPEDAIKYRKATFTVMAAHFGRIGAVVKGAPFDPKAVAANASLLATLSTLPWSAFGEGTTGEHTRAKPEVWSEADKFKAGGQQMVDALAKLDVAAKSGNLDQIKAAFGDAAKTCKSCHDNFRKE